jgi:cytoskeletal protein CcmA (bactofilin family)
MSVFDSKPKAPTAMPTSINPGTRINGDIASDADIRLDGNMVGNMSSKAKIVIGSVGTIEGDVECYSADISGKVTGNIDVKDILFLKSTAVILGNIATSKLVIENGAKFNGNCTMNNANTVSFTPSVSKEKNNSPANKKEAV